MIVGIDFGSSIGLAYATPDLSIAIPYCTVRSIIELAKKIIEKEPDCLVVGWPLLLNGQQGQQCARTMQMLNALLQLIPISYHLQDERFSSKFSSQFSPNFKNCKKNNRKEDNSIEHAHSAAWILQTYLDKTVFLRAARFNILN